MKTHTPGLWHTQGCTIYAGKNRVAQTWDTCDDLPTPTMEADADLIAAAPELLAALESILSSTCGDIGDDGYDGCIRIEAKSLDRAREVISKAKGGAL